MLFRFSYANELTCVWEEMSNIEGDTEFFDDHFRRRAHSHLPGNFAPVEHIPKGQQLEADHLLALSLAQDEPFSTPPQSPSRQVPTATSLPSCTQSDYELARRLQIEEEDTFRRAQQHEVTTSQSSYQLGAAGQQNPVEAVDLRRRPIASSQAGIEGKLLD